ncbi:MAG TPA: BatA domain-containing protein, partial [Tepidisphaeraceae bacterium]|nr:BatA domain-containing protein [Tepidisphaeraceae bacterium]
MTFLFFSALLALPLALLPVLLHLLFRRKTPVVMFPTLRFVKSAIKHTAARRKVQRWLLLACRVLLLALLIFAAAQPARQVASAWMSSGDATVVAIVVDTSYSMLLKEGRDGGAESTLLARAGANLDELLASDLVRNARVALFLSNPPADGRPEGFQTPAGIKQNWTGLQPQAGPAPLAARVERAVKLLAGDPAPQKWLFVITDVQAKEFSQPLLVPADLKAALIYLTPSDPRSAGVTAVAVDPEDPIPGIGAEAAVEAAGRAGDSRAVAVTVSTVDAPQSPLVVKPPKVAGLDAGGRAQVRFDVSLPAERFMLVRGALQAADNLPWDDERVQLIEVPPRQAVTLLETTPTTAGRFLRLALDPTDGAAREWPLVLTRSPNLTGKETAAAVVLTQWPEAAQAKQLRDFARGGGTLLMCLQPGMEDSFAGLSAERRAVLLELLPGAPGMAPASDGAYRAGARAAEDPLLRGLTDKKFDLGGIVVRRFVPLAQPDGRDARVVLSMSTAHPGPG